MGTTYQNNGANLPIQYAHTTEFFSKGHDQEGPFYAVKYYISDWSQSDAFVNALRGIVQMTGGTGGTVTRTAPHQHPLSPNLYCMSAVAEGVGTPILNASGLPNYSQGAIITAEYRPMVPYGFVNDGQNIDPSTPLVWCTQEIEFGTEMLVIPNSNMLFSGTIRRANYPFKVNVNVTHLSLTFHKLPYIPMGQVRACRGRVNLTTFLGASAGCVLFKGAKTVRDFNTDGTVVQKVMLMFAERDSTQPWNYLLDPYDMTWRQVLSSVGSNPIYQSIDFTPLILF